jgi:hypothetical protein
VTTPTIDPFIWRPTPAVIERANVSRLMRACGAETYPDLAR